MRAHFNNCISSGGDIGPRANEGSCLSCSAESKRCVLHGSGRTRATLEIACRAKTSRESGLLQGLYHTFAPPGLHLWHMANVLEFLAVLVKLLYLHAAFIDAKIEVP